MLGVYHVGTKCHMTICAQYKNNVCNTNPMCVLYILGTRTCNLHLYSAIEHRCTILSLPQLNTPEMMKVLFVDNLFTRLDKFLVKKLSTKRTIIIS